jgi:hypothetical protein
LEIELGAVVILVDIPWVLGNISNPPVVNDKVGGCWKPLVAGTWKSFPANSSPPGYWKVSNADWRSNCAVGVYKTEFDGLADLPVTSDLAEDI